MNIIIKPLTNFSVFMILILILNCSQADVYTNATKDVDRSKQLLNIQLITNAEPVDMIYSLPAGHSLYLKAMGNYNDLSTADVSDEVTWEPSDPAILTIDPVINNGETSYFARGLIAGTSDVIATLDGVESRKITIEVTYALFLAVIVQPYSAVFPEVPSGLTQQFTAYGYYSDEVPRVLTTGVTWDSSNTGVATISSTGLATTNSRGTTTISAEYEGISSEDIFNDSQHSAMLTVALLSSIEITPATTSGTWTKPLGFNQQFTAIGHYAGYTCTHDITNQVAWASNNESVATITSTGNANTVSFGTALITASYGITPPAGVQFIVDNKIFVSPVPALGGIGDNDNGDGTIDNNAPTPLATIEKALSIATTYRGMEIHVAAGSYPENVILSGGTSLFGGYISDFSDTTRYPKIYVTTIQNPDTAVGPTVYLSSGDSAYTTLIDGFTINAGNTGETYGIKINTDSVPSYNTIISNNNISGSTSGSNNRTYAVYINDINHDSSANTYNILLDSNHLFGGMIPGMPISADTYAIYASKSISNPKSIKINLWNNTINGGSAATAIGGTFTASTYCVYADNVYINIYNNTMFIGSAVSTNMANEYGVYLLNNTATNITNNIIFGDNLIPLPNGYEYGIYEGDSTDPNIVNNNCVYNMNMALYHDNTISVNSGNLNDVGDAIPEPIGNFFYFFAAYFTSTTPAGIDNVSIDPVFEDTYWHLSVFSPASVHQGGMDLSGVIAWTDGPKLEHDKDGAVRTTLWSIGAYIRD